jgi:hypothetical protein
MEIMLGFSIIAFVVVVVTDTIQQRQQHMGKNR